LVDYFLLVYFIFMVDYFNCAAVRIHSGFFHSGKPLQGFFGAIGSEAAGDADYLQRKPVQIALPGRIGDDFNF